MATRDVWILVASFLVYANAWEPDAGLVIPLTANKVVTVTSNPKDKDNIIDGNSKTMWQSGAVLPTGYLTRPELNVLLGACANNRCNAVGTSSDLEKATDGSFYGGAIIRPTNGRAELTVSTQQAEGVRRFLVKGKFDGSTQFNVSTANGDVVLRVFNSANNYQTITIIQKFQDVINVKFASTGQFQIFEVAALTTRQLFEQASVDLGSEKEVGVIRTRHWAGGNALSTQLLGSLDQQEWFLIAELDPNALSQVNTRLPVPTHMRHVAVRHNVKERDWAKVYVWEISAYDIYGSWGPPPSPAPQKKSFRQLLGVNGIWGWQTNKYSNSLGPNEGPRLYYQVASHARNYHNMNWDVKSPSNVPDYDKMAQGGGTEVHWWLNWDREYRAWQDAGLVVTQSIQFLNKTQPTSSWTNPEQNAFAFGQAFARHFGPRNGSQLSSLMEIGNEPWDYPAGFYAQVLRGMSSGAKAGNADLPVMPCALQADDKSAEGNYIGSHLPEDVAPNLFGVNSHHYSFYNRPDGVRIAVYPEHPDSAFNGIRNVLRWRNANMAGKEAWVTEWGWDSPGVGETCANSECVTEHAQAVYGVRGLFILARHGVDATTWYFFANTQNCNTLFCRSGLTGSKDTNFAKKKVFRAFQAALHHVGVVNFHDVLLETKDGHVYSAGPKDAPATHFIAWAPISADDTAVKTVTITSDRRPQTTWSIDGDNATGERVANPSTDGNTWTVRVSAVPIVIQLQ